jgi:putative intracellular protease/amidase
MTNELERRMPRSARAGSESANPTGRRVLNAQTRRAVLFRPPLLEQDAAAQKAISGTVKLADMKSQDFGTVFYVGGHGPMWDLAESADSIALLESFYNSGKPIALVCHSPGVLRHVTYKGAPLVKGKRVTGFTNGEEEA